LSGDTQQRVLDAIAELTSRTIADGDYHDCVMSFKGLWGRPAVFVAVCPETVDVTVAERRLLAYVRAKSADLEADRG
jgi:hypothetical protein